MVNENSIIGKTHKEVLEEISKQDIFTETDHKIIKYWCLQSDLKNAVVICGLVYPKGLGQCFPLNQFAKRAIKCFGVLKMEFIINEYEPFKETKRNKFFFDFLLMGYVYLEAFIIASEIKI